jgi:hypothetical protein
MVLRSGLEANSPGAFEADPADDLAPARWASLQPAQTERLVEFICEMIALALPASGFPDRGVALKPIGIAPRGALAPDLE